MPQIRKPPVTAKMYRHFAATTVTITLTIGLFANGQGRQALADEVEQQVSARQEAARVDGAQVEKFGKPKLIQRSAPRDAGWGYQGYGDSFDADYGRPDDGSSSSTTMTTSRGRANPNAKVPGAYAPYGISPAAWAAMSDEERADFLRDRTRPQPKVTADQHQRQVDGLLAASAARAGAADE